MFVILCMGGAPQTFEYSTCFVYGHTKNNRIFNAVVQEPADPVEYSSFFVRGPPKTFEYSACFVSRPTIIIKYSIVSCQSRPTPPCIFIIVCTELSALHQEAAETIEHSQLCARGPHTFSHSQHVLRPCLILFLVPLPLGSRGRVRTVMFLRDR